MLLYRHDIMNRLDNISEIDPLTPDIKLLFKYNKRLYMTPDILFIYITAVSIISAVMTVYDKTAAKYGKRRIPESVLLLVAFLGGGAAEYITMLVVRHKTKHMLFMVSLPLIILLQVILIYLLIIAIYKMVN